MKTNRYLLTGALCLAACTPCYADDKGTIIGLLAVMIVFTAIGTLCLGFMLKFILPLLKVNMSSRVVFIIAFVVNCLISVAFL